VRGPGELVRIGFIARYFPALSETFVQSEALGVQAAGDAVRVYSLGTRADHVHVTVPPELEVVQIPRRPLAGRLRADSAGMRWLRDHQRPKDVARLPWLRARLGDIDHLHTHFAGEAAEWAHALHLDLGLPYSLVVHAADLFKPRPSFLEVLRGASTVFTVAQHHVDLLAKEDISATLCRCGPDLARFQPEPLSSGPLRALFVGRDVPKKGLDALLAAWPEAAGPDDALHVVSDASRSWPRGVTGHGFRTPAQVREHLAWANLFVLPCRRASDGDMDGVPLALMEALAVGRPVVSTALSGIPELVDPEVGWLLPPDDPAALVSALREASAEERARRGARGPARLRARGFTLASQVAGVRKAWSA